MYLGLALLTYQNTGKWANSQTLWAHDARRVVGHVNARQAYLDQGDIEAAIAECGWLLSAVSQQRATPRQVRDIRHMCFKAFR